MDETMRLAAVWPARTSWSPLRSLRHWYRERRTTAALMSLDDAQLKDIGIYRGEIPDHVPWRGVAAPISG
jgi:uncharacterized protein YjiS (DUF1127 family)